MTLADHRGKWVVLFFYHRDFTFICPTEIAAFARMDTQFQAENAVVIGASTDSFFSHSAWFDADERLHGVNYPVIADTSHKLATAYTVLLTDGSTLRGTFIIDPDGNLRHVSINEPDVGRSPQETLRVLQGLRSGQLCPVDWQPGQDTLTTVNEWLTQVFPRVSSNVLAKASSKLQTVKYGDGDTIFRQGDASDNLYIVVSGEVEVIRHSADRNEVPLGEFGAGAILGEIGLLMDTRRTADVRARSDVELLALDWASFRELLDESDPTTRDLMRIVEERWARTPQ